MLLKGVIMSLLNSQLMIFLEIDHMAKHHAFKLNLQKIGIQIKSHIGLS